MNYKRLAAATLAILIALALHPRASLASGASDKAEVVAAVHQYLDNLDDKTLSAALAMCDSEVSIVDEFPPHIWHGPTTCADWWKDFRAYNQANGVTDDAIALGAPQTVDVSGDRAYFVAPMTYTFKQHGKSVEETASFTVALRRTSAGWRITAWTYSKQTYTEH